MVVFVRLMTLLGVWLSQAGSPALAAGTLAWAGSAADSLVHSQFEQRLVPRLNAAMPGLRIELLPASGADLAGRDLVDRLMSGKLQMASLSAAQLVGLDPWFELADLPGLATDVPTAHKQADAYRERAATLLRERGRLRLIALSSDQALALYCRSAFVRLADIKGRRVTADPGMIADLLEALGATVLRMPRAAMRESLASGRADCAVGGTMAGNLAGWAEVTTHLFALPLAWRLGHVVIAEAGWTTLDPPARQALQTEFRQYEAAIWSGASVYTREGINCNAGVEPCKLGRKGRMNIVIGTDTDRMLMGRLMQETVLPAWVLRCGRACASSVNDALLRPAGLKPLP